jgi:bifunctional non-homologous end joining protein LigD
MSEAFEFCIPTTGTNVPSGPDWLHEIKYDGYRLIVHRDHDRVRLITKSGYDWSKRFAWIVEAALKAGRSNSSSMARPSFWALTVIPTSMRCIRASTTRKSSYWPSMCLAMDGDDLRDLPLSMRKANLARLLARRPDGIFLSEFEQGEIGPDLFRKACEFGLEGLVSKHRDRPYRGGRQKHWIKVKNRKHPAMSQEI